MAFLPALAPYIAAGGALYSGAKQQQSSDYNAKIAGQEHDLSINQANAQEGQVRRASRQAIGAQSAAFGAAGVGYGGSSETSLDQSAVNEEMDALNTRYKGAITGYGYGVKAGIDKSEGNQEMASGTLLAGGQFLKSMGPNYSFAPSGLGPANAGS